MLGTLNDIKKGVKLLHENEPYVVMESNFVKMSMRKPVMQTKMKNLLNGKVVEINYHQGDKMEEADMMKKKVDYLYNDGDNYFFMSQDDFEQFSLPKENLGAVTGYIKDGDKVDALYFNNVAVSISAAPKVELKVISAPEAVKGNSASGRTTKMVTMETGLELAVPIFIKEGEILRVNTETGEYVERAQ